MRRSARHLAWLSAVPALVLGLGAQPAQPQKPELARAQPQPDTAPPTTATPAREARVPVAERFDKRLAALTPDKPQEYFELGEEVADAAFGIEERQLAIQLYVLAFDLSLRPGGRPSTAAAACLGLAAIRAERDQVWLQYLARIIDPRRALPEWLGRQGTTTESSTAYQIVTALGYVRSGEGVRARQLLDRPEVKANIDLYDRMLENIGYGGGISRVLRDAQRWPCPQCANERIVRKPGNPPEYKLCPACEGDPGAQMTDAEFIAQLRFESLLLQGNQRSWAAQISADGGAPLKDADPASVASYFDVDTTLVLWRSGKWVADPTAPPRPKPVLPPPPPPPTKPGEPIISTTPTAPSSGP